MNRTPVTPLPPGGSVAVAVRVELPLMYCGGSVKSRSGAVLSTRRLVRTTEFVTLPALSVDWRRMS